MNKSTSNFDELSSKWSSGESIYSSSILLADTSPSGIFEIAFSNKSQKFFAELIKNTSNLPQPTYDTAEWKDINNENNNNCIGIKQRSLRIQSIETGLAFFLRKNITTNIIQTSYFNVDDSLIIFSVAECKIENKKADHLIIDKWIIKWDVKSNENNLEKRKVSISVKANIIWTTYQTPTAMIIKSKWLRFYQSRFERWRNLIRDYIVKHNFCVKKTNLMRPFIGCWNKLNSNHLIKITLNKIEYSDGSHFNVSINETTNEILATYARNQYKGYLDRDLDQIKWNNGSIWIRNGYKKYEGEWIQKSTEQKYIISCSMTIKLPITGKEIKFMMNKINKITYSLNGSTTSAILSKDASQLMWNNGTVWIKLEKYKLMRKRVNRMGENDKIKTAKPLFQPKMKNKFKLKSNPIPIKKTKETEIEIEIEIENKKEIENKGEKEAENEEFDICDFDELSKNQIISKEVDKLSIKTDEHFIIVDNINISDKNENKMDIINRDNENKMDEWLLL